MAEAVKEVEKETSKKPEVKPVVKNDGPKCFNCGAALVGTKCPECQFDSSSLINYHDL